MSLINIIIICLSIIPLIGVISDLEKGKIKNLFIFPYFLLLIILTFFIKDFYILDNIIQLIIIFTLGYMFYIYNKWGAGDGKYIIILGLSIVIIGYLKGVDNIIILFLTSVFLIISIIIIFYLLANFKKILKIKKVDIDFKLLSTVTIFSIIFIIGFIIKIYFNNEYTYIFIFLTIFAVISYYNQLKINKYVEYGLIFVGIGFAIYQKNYYGYIYSFLIFNIFVYISKFLELIFNNIDIVEKNIFDIKQGDILDEKSLEIINKNLKSDYVLSPLQGYEVFSIISFYKKKNKNIKIFLYKDIKIGFYLYFGYILSIIYIYYSV